MSTVSIIWWSQKHSSACEHSSPTHLLIKHLFVRDNQWEECWCKDRWKLIKMTADEVRGCIMVQYKINIFTQDSDTGPFTISGCRFPFFFVHGLHKTLGPSVDYKRLNEIAIKNLWLVPLVERLQGADMFTKLSLWSAHCLVCINEKGEWKTAFDHTFEHTFWTHFLIFNNVLHY